MVVLCDPLFFSGQRESSDFSAICTIKKHLEPGSVNKVDRAHLLFHFQDHQGASSPFLLFRMILFIYLEEFTVYLSLEMTEKTHTHLLFKGDLFLSIASYRGGKMYWNTVPCAGIFRVELNYLK